MRHPRPPHFSLWFDHPAAYPVLAHRMVHTPPLDPPLLVPILFSSLPAQWSFAFLHALSLCLHDVCLLFCVCSHNQLMLAM